MRVLLREWDLRVDATQEVVRGEFPAFSPDAQVERISTSARGYVDETCLLIRDACQEGQGPEEMVTHTVTLVRRNGRVTDIPERCGKFLGQVTLGRSGSYYAFHARPVPEPERPSAGNAPAKASSPRSPTSAPASRSEGASNQSALRPAATGQQRSPSPAPAPSTKTSVAASAAPAGTASTTSGGK